MRTALVGIAVAGLIAGCGDDSSTSASGVPVESVPPARKAETRVKVHETEYKLDPANADGGSKGLVAVLVVNDGKVVHSLAVDGPNGQVQLDGEVPPGQSATLEVDLDKPGTYNWYCPLDGHRAKGMSGTITVGGSTPDEGGGGATTVTNTTTTATQTVPTETQTTTQTHTQTETRTVTTPSTSTSTSPTATTGSPSGY